MGLLFNVVLAVFAATGSFLFGECRISSLVNIHVH
jgi:phage-related holin